MRAIESHSLITEKVIIITFRMVPKFIHIAGFISIDMILRANGTKSNQFILLYYVFIYIGFRERTLFFTNFIR